MKQVVVKKEIVGHLKSASEYLNWVKDCIENDLPEKKEADDVIQFVFLILERVHDDIRTEYNSNEAA